MNIQTIRQAVNKPVQTVCLMHFICGENEMLVVDILANNVTIHLHFLLLINQGFVFNLLKCLFFAQSDFFFCDTVYLVSGMNLVRLLLLIQRIATVGVLVCI